MTARDTLLGILRQWTESHDAAAKKAETLVDASDAELLRDWSARIRETGAAKGWSTWAAAFISPDVEFVDTGMPATETIVAELRRLDRVALFREAADAVALDRDSTVPSGGKGAYRRAMNRAEALLRQLADEAERGKDTTGGSQPREGESTPAPYEPYSHTDAHNHRLMFLTATDAKNRPYVWLQADNLAIGGANVNVWLPLEQASALDRALDAGFAFEFTDHTGDTLTAERDTPWTSFTLTRNADDEPAAAVRVVVLTARLSELRAGIKDAASRAACATATCATEDTGGEEP